MSAIMMNSLKKLLMSSVPKMVIKYAITAKENETVESKRLGDRYVAAVTQTDSFYTYPSFSKAVLQSAGFNEEEIKLYSSSKNKIPVVYRDTVVKFAREEYIANYKELNDYYRMLNGLPDLEDIEEVWLDKGVYDEFGIEPMPVHEIDKVTQSSMDSLGCFDEIRKNYPDKKYLNYLGNRKIDVVTARRADNFELLYFPKTISYPFYRDFTSYYEECREYFLTVIYNQYYSSQYKGYDNYMAFNILIMTINKMTSLMLLRFVERDFYDVETTRAFLEAYGVPISDTFTFEKLKLLAKNLNILLKSKSTTQVFIDVMDLMGYSNFTLTQYYLVKQHRIGADGKPVFVYKTVTEEDGTTHEELDKESMYNFYFSRVPATEKDVQKAIKDTANKLRYEQVVSVDDYWVEDKDTRDRLLNTDFNYIETKYMDINVVYRMHKIIFETVYLTRLILDKSDTKNIYVSMPKLSSSDVTLFDVMIMLICLLCKYYHIEPDLLNSPSKILYIMGFNFNADFDRIKADIKRYNLDNRLLKYIEVTRFVTPQDVNDMYVNVRELELLLVELMNNAHDIETYRAYDNLYRTLLWTELNNDIYAINGVVPDQFTDCLKARSHEMFNYYLSLETQDDISDSISYITTKLTSMLTDTHYLEYIRIMDTTILDAIIKLLRFFKSYTVDLKDANVCIIFDSRYYNMIHVANKLIFGDKDGKTYMTITDNSFIDLFKDRVKRYVAVNHIRAEANIDTFARFMADIMIHEPSVIREQLRNLKEKGKIDQYIEITDALLDLVEHITLPNETIKLEDGYSSTHTEVKYGTHREETLHTRSKVTEHAEELVKEPYKLDDTSYTRINTRNTIRDIATIDSGVKKSTMDEIIRGRMTLDPRPDFKPDMSVSDINCIVDSINKNVTKIINKERCSIRDSITLKWET